MKTSLTKRLGCFVLVLLTIASLSLPAFAASGSLDKTVKEKIPNLNNVTIKGFGYKTTGTIKCYTDSSLSKRGSAWISLRYDECTIERVANNGRALYIKFPVGGGRYLKRWFKTSDFLGINSLTTKFPAYTVTKKMITYQRSNGGAKYGYAAAGDTIYLINMNSNFVTFLYPLATGGFKIGNAKHSVFQNSTESIIDSPGAFVHPMNGFHRNFTQWGVRPSYRSGSSRQWHVGVDYMSNSDRNIYAFTDGTVVSTGFQKANGNFILIEHRIPDANGKLKTVYSFYAHLSKVSVSRGQKVSAGKKIGIVGRTGSSAGTATHLHFSLFDYKWTNGGAYGYVTKFSGNKVKYEKVTYFNPYYVIAFGRLP